MKYIPSTLFALVAASFCGYAAVEGRIPESTSYGVDVSFPIHSQNVAPIEENPLGNRAAAYEEFIKGCRKYYGRKSARCDQTEKDRIAMSLRQPQSMQNYTDTGFLKIRAPEKLRKLLTDYWEANKHNMKKESWPAGNTYTNHWAAPTYMVSIEDTGLRGGGQSLKKDVWEAARETIEEWTGMELIPTSQYGIRVYTEGAILSPHVDRMPLVSSAIVNVAQDVDEDWPLEVYGRDGNAVNVTMHPGDMVLYESHSLLHGRVFPLKGRYYANIFIHFEPTGEILSQKERNEHYQHANRHGHKYALNNHHGLPPYILENSPESSKWLRSHDHWESPAAAAAPASLAHHAATVGDIKTLHELATTKGHLLHSADANGWMPIHEASRAGNIDAIKLLVDLGANPNERTNFGSGGSPLYWAKKVNGENHESVHYLSSIGALELHPEL